MISNEERKEVARRLKSFYETLFLVENMNLIHFVRMLFGSCGLDTGENSLRDFVRRLIDLIEPRTCKRVPGKMKYGRRRPACSECGYSLGDNRWSFCPNCGCEVVDDA